VQDRDFVNAPDFNYLSLAYNVSITNQLSGANPIFTKVEATAPDGAVYTFKPSVGNNTLVLIKPDNTPTGGPLIRVAASYRNPATPGNPAAKEPSSYFLPVQLSDDQLRVTPEQGVWKLEFFHVDVNKANVIQTHRLLARVPTMAEAKQKKLADLTPALRAELIAGTATTGAIVFEAPNADDSIVDFSAEGNADAWTVPQGAPVPTSINVYGSSATNVQFDDVADIPAGARKIKVFCSAASMGDDHCTTLNGASLYAAGTSINLFQLAATEANQIQYLKGFATYQLNPN
jgi:hypothetical protein